MESRSVLEWLIVIFVLLIILPALVIIYDRVTPPLIQWIAQYPEGRTLLHILSPILSPLGFIIIIIVFAGLIGALIWIIRGRETLTD